MSNDTYNYLTLLDNKIIIGNTIEDIWRDAIWCCVRNGYDYRIERGSYEGDKIRRQLDSLMIKVLTPWKRPLSVRLPESIPFSIVTEDYIEEYFMSKILSDEKSDNEDYTYGQFIMKQLDDVIGMLQNTKNTNQAVIEIGNGASIYFKDPPCLKLIDFKVINNKLNLITYWRSWDLINGLPVNLGGMQLLKEYVLANVRDLEDGELICYSSGGHIYDHNFDLVNMLNVDKIKNNS